MQKWSNGAKKRKAVIDAAEVKSNDMDAIVSAIAGIAPGQIKKLLTDDVIAVLQKYGVKLE